MRQDEIIELLKNKKAMLEGHFLLTSGRHSNIYIEKFRLLEDPILLDQICKQIASKFINLKVDIVLGAAIGGILIAGGVGRYLNKKHIFTERVNGNMELRRGFSIKPSDNVLIVEDIVTTGSSIFEMIDVVKKCKANIINISCIVNRSEEELDIGYPFTSLLRLPAQSWEPDSIPDWLKNIPITSRGRTGKINE
ncbi:MAG: orotate phosphoribosyltransferase [Candidatus Marinimicrobia bacterium]|nr:orotate phosphoribosyltransferase [Candidatus Neomarinimicrobiota bacterium]